MRPLYFFALLLLVAACGTAETEGTTTTAEPETPSSSDDFLIIPGERVGKITAENATQTEILELYGNDAVTDSIYIGEGFFWPGVRVYPNTENELQIAWDAQAYTDLPALLRVQSPDTDWKTDQGITIGTTLEELIGINGGHFKFLGFGWDYGGKVSNLEDGDISNDLFLTLEEVTGTTPELLGDQEISTDNPAVQPKNIQVVVLETRF